ncbi:similar to An02g13400 [Aspergillus luchuensis]|uniref:Similar to An02g13400 n=1 Tax=Aspergillus kawachii TaxID=1069201 RepID=A0A146FDX0_ASPKA|nr:similar to An02g13400 [Aspergillus luchuensis]
MRPSTRLLILTTPPIILTYTTHRYLCTLEAKYPPIDPTTTTSLALRTPSNPTTQHCPEVDVYEAKHVPVKSLLKRYSTLLQSHPKTHDSTTTNKATLTNAWILTFLNTKPLLVEGSLIGLIKNKSYSPGDTGVTDPEHKSYVVAPGLFHEKVSTADTITLESRVSHPSAVPETPCRWKRDSSKLVVLGSQPGEKRRRSHCIPL